jgi:hypothetical protein
MLRGDPGSCSALGAELHRVADTLRTACATARPEVVDPTGHGTLIGLADLTDGATAVFQRYAVELAEALEKVRHLETDAARHALEIDGWVVVDRWGPRRLDAADTGAHADIAHQLQRRLDRIHSRIGRARAQLVRSCDELTAALRDTSGRLRAEAGATSG